MKKAFIYIHGWSSYKHKLDCAKRVVTQAGYEFVSFDMPLHGEFQGVSYEQKHTFSSLTEYVINYLNQLDYDEVIIAAHSMGGAMILLNHQKINLKISKVILIDPLNQYTGIEDINTLAQYLTINEDKQKDSLFNKLLKHGLTNTKTLLKILKTFIHPQFKRQFSQVQLDKEIKWYLIFGKSDIFINPHDTALWLKTLNQELKFYLIENAGHNPFTDNPASSLSVLQNIIKD